MVIVIDLNIISPAVASVFGMIVITTGILIPSQATLLSWPLPLFEHSHSISGIFHHATRISSVCCDMLPLLHHMSASTHPDFHYHRPVSAILSLVLETPPSAGMHITASVRIDRPSAWYHFCCLVHLWLHQYTVISS